MRFQYPIVLIPDEESGYAVVVPDLPGCLTQGETVEESIAMAKDAAEGWLEVTLEDREEIPSPSSYEAVARDLDKILDGLIETPEERELVILAKVQIDIPKVAA